MRQVRRQQKTLSGTTTINEEGGHEEDDKFLLPESQNFVPGTAEDFTEKMRINGLRWRHELRKKVKNDPNLRELLQWVSNRPSSMDEPTRPLGQMLQEIKALRSEVDQIIDMADGYVQIRIATFERHVYPSAFLRSYLRAMSETDDLAGGVESAFLYAFHMQYRTLPAERTTLDLQMLRASSVQRPRRRRPPGTSNRLCRDGIRLVPKYVQHLRQARG